MFNISDVKANINLYSRTRKRVNKGRKYIYTYICKYIKRVLAVFLVLPIRRHRAGIFEIDLHPRVSRRPYYKVEKLAFCYK